MKTKTLYIAFDGCTFDTPQRAKDHEKRMLLVALVAEQLKAMFTSSEFPDRVRASPEATALTVAEVLGGTLLSHATLAWMPREGVRKRLQQLIEQLGGDATDLPVEGVEQC